MAGVVSSSTYPLAGTELPMIYRKRRNIELFLVLIATSLGAGALAITQVNLYGQLSPTIYPFMAGWVLTGVLVHFLVRWKWAWADPVILPSVLMLNGIGLTMLWRIDQISSPVHNGAIMQLLWTGLGMVAFVGFAFLVKDYRVLRRFPYLLFLVGMALLLLPLLPGIGHEVYGARIWIRLGPLSFQPSEIAKLVLVFAFASYLADRREVLALAGGRFLGIDLPRIRDLGPIMLMWSASIVVLVFQNDFGTSLLFFGMFVMMLYVATEQKSWPILGVVMFSAAAIAVFIWVPHVGVRVESWLRPFTNFDKNYQVIQAQFGMAWGGLTGRGLGLGRPGLTPLARSDMIASAVGEELGLAGLIAVIVLYAIIVFRGMKVALISSDTFGKLISSGLSFVMTLQVFAIIGGVTRLLPLTGLTTPFMSQGGSSMISNWVLVAVLMAVSHQARKPSIELEAASQADQLAAKGDISVGEEVTGYVPQLHAPTTDVCGDDSQTRVIR